MSHNYEKGHDSGWEGWDLDGTISVYTKGDYNSFIVGPPIPKTVIILKRHLKEGRNCKIFTARVNTKTETPERLEKVKAAIREWCIKHLGQELELTCEKDYHMYAFYDDRAVQVEANTGVLLEDIISDLRSRVCYLQSEVEYYRNQADGNYC